MTVTNTGNSADIFNLSVNGNDWNASLNQPNLPLNSGETGFITVTVTIPANAAQDEVDLVNLIATSQSDRSKSASTTVTTTANIPVLPPEFGLDLSPSQNAFGEFGSSVTYTLQITNLGNVADIFTKPLTFEPFARHRKTLCGW